MCVDNRKFGKQCGCGLWNGGLAGSKEGEGDRGGEEGGLVLFEHDFLLRAA